MGDGGGGDGSGDEEKERATGQREVDRFQRNLRAAFRDAEIDKAILPPGLLAFLKLPGRDLPDRMRSFFDDDDRPCTRPAD